MSLYFDRAILGSIDDAVSKYGDSEFKSPYRSTVPSLSMLKHAQSLAGRLLQSLEMPSSSDLHLEYQVHSPRGKGKASNTDLMVMAEGRSLAIEVKWTEPRYKTVSSWLGKHTEVSNRVDVLNGWIQLLRSHSKRPLDVEGVSGVVYQMLHRAASACVAEHPRLAYLLFHPSNRTDSASSEQIRRDLQHLHVVLGHPETFPFYIVDLQAIPTAAFHAIARLPRGESSTAIQVQAALGNEDPLFSFSEPVLTRI